MFFFLFLRFADPQGIGFILLFQTEFKKPQKKKTKEKDVKYIPLQKQKKLDIQRGKPGEQPTSNVVDFLD